MKKYIIREVEPEAAEFGSYFDDDGLTERGGDYCYNLFILNRDCWSMRNGFNLDEYRHVEDQARGILEGFEDVRNPGNPYNWNGYKNYKEVMEDFGIPYTSRKCAALRKWAERAEDGDPESVAAFLSITTGKKWAVDTARGYSQGDFCEIVYCPEHYPNGVKAYGEIWLGAAKEFCVIELDEDGTEGDCCYGYIVADCEARTDADYKRLVCDYAGIPEAETDLSME